MVLWVGLAWGPLHAVARAMGADVVPGRVERARAFGADVAYPLEGRTHEEVRAGPKDALAGEADRVVDATGHGRWFGGGSVYPGVEQLRGGGRFPFSAPATEDVPANARRCPLRGISVRCEDRRTM